MHDDIIVTSVQVENVTRVPLYIVALNRFARLGLATRYTPTRRFVQFEVDKDLAEKWPTLRDAASVILIYRERKD